MPQTYVEITQLPNAVLPLDGTELLEIVQNLENRQVSLASLAPSLGASYLTATSIGSLTGSRRLASGSGIVLTDGGPGGNFTITATGLTFNTASFVVMAQDGVFPNERNLIGTANQVIINDGGPGNPVTLSLPQSIAPASSPTFASLTLTNPLTAPNGGTGFSSYAIGDLLYANTTNSLAKLADVAAGSLLRSGGVATAPAWSTTTYPNTATIGDLLYASGANTYANLADVAVGSYLRSGGVGIAPLWSTITLPNAAAQGDIWFASATSTITALAKSATATRYLSNTGASNSPAWAQVDLTNGVTGRLPFANLTQGAALSVLGVTGNAIADNASIVAGVDGDVLRRSGTAVAFGSVILRAANFANPTATVGTAAVNGAAVTAMRSDGAPPISQSIAPTWSALHTFTNNPAILLDSSAPALRFRESDAAVDNRLWQVYSDSEQLRFSALNDAVSLETIWLTVDRTGTTIDTVVFPNGSVGCRGGIVGAVDTASTGVVLGVEGAGGAVVFTASGGVANGKRWDIVNNPAGTLDFRAVNDAYTVGNSFMTVTKSGATITDITMGGLVKPSADVTFTLGASAARWSTLFCTTVSDGATGTNATVTTSGTTALFGSGSGITQSSLYSNGNERIRAGSGGNLFMISVGTTASAANAFLNSGSSPVNELQRSTSSVRYKTDIQDVDLVDMVKLRYLRPISYRSLCDGDDKSIRWYGFIAEEVAKILPRMVAYDADGQPDGVQYERLSVLIVRTLQNVLQRLEDLEKKGRA